MGKNYLAMTLVAILTFGAYGYFQYTKWSGTQQAIAQAQSTIEKLRNDSAQYESQYRDLKKSYDEDFKSINDSMTAIYPSEENYTSMTRLLEGFVQQQNKSFDPMDLSDVKYGRPRLDPKTEYAILPVTLTLFTTRSNLEKFLTFVKNSGSLDNGVRLMDVRALSISFPSQSQTVASSTDPGSSEVLNVSVSLNAYYQKQAATPSSKNKQ